MSWDKSWKKKLSGLIPFGLSGSYVFGTDIEPSATKFSNTIEHDFHEIKDEWLDSFDFIYSNSHDHAKRSKKALGNWLKSLNDNGFCL